MKKRQILVIALLLASPVLLVQPASPAAPAGWAQEIPGELDSILDLEVVDAGHGIGILYTSAIDDDAGFYYRSTDGGWSKKTGDISGDGFNTTRPSLCYAGNSWYAMLENDTSNTARLYRSDNNGSSWAQKYSQSGVNIQGTVDCKDDKVAFVFYDGSGQIFRRSLDQGESWQGGWSLSDDNGAPTGGGTESASLVGDIHQVRWGDGNDIYASMGFESGSGFCAFYILKSDDNGIFWQTHSSPEWEPYVDNFGSCNLYQAGFDVSAGTAYTSLFQRTSTGGFPVHHVFVVNETDEGHDFNSEYSNGQFGCGTRNPTGVCEITANDSGGVLYSEGKYGKVYYFEPGFGTGQQVLDLYGGTFLQNPNAVSLTETRAVVAYADPNQGDRLEVRVSSVSSGGGGGADIVRAVNQATGLSVSPGGDIVAVRFNGGSDVDILNGNTLGDLGSIETPDCNRIGGVEAFDIGVAAVDCNDSNRGEFVLIRGQNGQAFSPNGCPTDACPSGLDTGPFFLSGPDQQDINAMSAFHWDYRYRESSIFGGFGNSFSVIAWAFSSFEDEVGVYAIGTVDNDLDRTEFALIEGLGTNGGVEDICAWSHGNQQHVAFADQTAGLWRFTVNIDIDTTGGLQRTLNDISVDIRDLQSLGANYGTSNAVSCAQDWILVSDGQGAITLLNFRTRAPVTGWPIQAGAFNNGVALNGNGHWSAYVGLDGVQFLDFNGNPVGDPRPLPSGSFVDVAIQNDGSNVWVLTTENVARYSFSSTVADAPKPKDCIGITNQTQLDECLEDNPHCDRDTDSDGLVDCIDPDDDNDGIPDSQDDDDDGNGIPDCQDPDHPLFGCTGDTAGGGATGGSGFLEGPFDLQKQATQEKLGWTAQQTNYLYAFIFITMMYGISFGGVFALTNPHLIDGKRRSGDRLEWKAAFWVANIVTFVGGFGFGYWMGLVPTEWIVLTIVIGVGLGVLAFMRSRRS